MKKSLLIVLLSTLCIAMISAFAACSVSWSEQEFEGHNWSEWMTVRESTCTVEGRQERICYDCGIKQTEKLAALGHEEDPLRVAGTLPTCTADGNVEYYVCTRCNKKFAEATCETEIKYVNLPAIGHNFDYEHATYEWATDYTACTATVYCTACNEKLLESAIVRYSVTERAKCTESGTGTYTATFLNNNLPQQTKTVELAAFGGHVFEAPQYTWNVSETHTATCTATSICNRCYEIEKKTIEGISGDYTAPTCTEEGKYTYTADFTAEGFGRTTKTEAIPALGHDYNIINYVWDNDNTSVTAKATCSRCDTEVLNETVTTTTSTIVEPTCITTGTKLITAEFASSYFDAQYKTETLDVIPHAYANPVVTNPTCTENGYITSTCTMCGDSKIDGYIKALGHAWGEWTVTTAATCEGEGEETRTCSRNDATETREIAALGHAWMNPEWTWAADYSTATAKFVCTHDSENNHNRNISAENIAHQTTIDSTTVKNTYTATVEFNGRTFTDTKTETEETANTYEAFAAAISAGSEITLNEDITVTDSLVVPKTADIDLNGHKIIAAVSIEGDDKDTYYASLEGATAAAKYGDAVTLYGINSEDPVSFTIGKVTVTVPAEVKKSGDTLTVKVTDYTSDEADELGTFTTALKSNNSLYDYFNVELKGLAEDNEEKIQIKYSLPDLPAELNYRSNGSKIYQGTARSAISTNTTQPSYIQKTSDGKEITVYTTILGSYTFCYQIQTGNNPYVVLSADFDEQIATTQIGYGGYALTDDVDELKFNFEKFTPTADELESIYSLVQSSYGAYQSEVKISAYRYSYENFYSFTNATYITFPCVLEEGFTNVYLLGSASNLTTVEGGYKVAIASDTEGKFYIVATYETEATKALKEQIAAMDENDKEVKITSSVADGIVDLADVATQLGFDGVIISGALDDNATVVKSTGSTISGNNITFTNITVYSGGLTLEGDYMLVSSSRIEQAYGSGSTLVIRGTNNTIKNVVITHLQAGSSGGRYGALNFEGTTSASNMTDAQTHVTNVNNVTITSADYKQLLKQRYIGMGKYTEEEIEEILAQITDDPHEFYKTDLGPSMFSNVGGIIFRNLDGVINVNNSVIDVPVNALHIGIDAEPRYGWVNVSNTVINSSSMGTDRVDYTKFTNTTFKNTWTDGPFVISSGTSYQGNLNYIFKDCTFETALTFALGTSYENTGVCNPKITFENCTFNGTLMTEDNYQALISQYLSFSMSVTNYDAVIDTMSYENGVLTIVPKRVQK